MEVVISIIISLLSCLSLSAQTVTEYFNVGNPIKFCDTDYYLSWSAHLQEIYYIQEYLPKGETFERYTQMFTVSVIFGDKTPAEAVQAKIAELEQQKQTDPVINYWVAENDGKYILDFVVSDSSDGKLNFVEFDLHYYQQLTINGKKASVLSFYSSRAYGDDIIPFIQSIPEKRITLYDALGNSNLKPEFTKK